MKKTTAPNTRIGFGELSRTVGGLPSGLDAQRSTEVTGAEKELLARALPDRTGPVPQPASRRISLEYLINRLNFVNFQEGRIQLYFSGRDAGRGRLVPAVPLPCSGRVLDCAWVEAPDEDCLRGVLQLKHVLVPHGERFIQADPDAVEMHRDGCRLALPEISCETSHRRIERQRCRDIRAQLLQNSASFPGALLDFTSSSFRVELEAAAPQRSEGIDAALPVQVIFQSGRQTLYSSECRILRTAPGRGAHSCVLEPLRHEIRRYRSAEFRSDRQTLNPSPNIIFRHPLTQKRVELKVADLSGSGFSVEEDETASVLLPGLILPEVELSFGTIFRIRCSAQVVFRKPLSDPQRRRRVRCGLALIDVSARDHIKLLGILHQVKDRNAYVCNDVDPEALWDFLFDTGFIYPAKYVLIEKNKKDIKRTYTKLYRQSPDIARHFVYQEDGVILGHMATIRFWERTWLIHHHAARKSALPKAGLAVLDQIGRFVHDSFRIRGLRMDYMMCFYRPQNRFPSRVFGGVARHIDNPQCCSVDPLAYVKLEGARADRPALPDGWEVGPAAAADFEALTRFYDRASGGVMLNAMDLDGDAGREDRLCREFQKHGFKRERHLFALRRGGSPRAFIVVNVSDIGLNLSDLVHCLNVFVLDPRDLPPETLLSALRQALRATRQHGIPALIFPLSYAEENRIPIEKTYHLWAFHISEADSQSYYKYLNRLTKRV